MTAHKLEPGIYFGLSEEIYHSSAALSAHGIIDFHEGESVFWLNSWMNKNKKETETTEAMRFGTATHRLILEPSTFREKYAVIPFDDIAPGEKVAITGNDYRKMKEMADVIHGMVEMKKYLSNGLSEVTIVWDDPDTGIRMRCRQDYMMPFLSIEYKTIKSIHDDVIRSDLNRRGYGIQCAVYLEARLAAKAMLREYFSGDCNKKGGKSPIFSLTPPDEKWLRAFAESNYDDVYFLFQRNTPPFAARPIRLDDASMARFHSGVIRVRKRLKKLLDKYGEDKWPVCTGDVQEFSSIYGSATPMEID